MSMKNVPVIIDTDPGTDDTLAILLALASPELHILGFIVSYGNSDLQSSYNNVLKIYEAVSKHIDRPDANSIHFNTGRPERDRPYLALGPEGPLEGDLHSAQYFHGRDGLGDISQRHPDLTIGRTDNDPLSHPQLRISEKSGRDLAFDILKSHPPRTITYIALGPLTNLALMMRHNPVTVRERIGRVVCMGGALDVPGNTSPVAEFNFFADPYAVKELLETQSPHVGIPLDRFVLLPLDITTPHDLPFPFYQSKVDPSFDSTALPSQAHTKPPLHHFTSSFLERTREIMLEFGKDAVELHDVVAVWCAIENPPVVQEDGLMPTLRNGWKAERKVFQIERTGELTRGMLVVDRRMDEGAYVSGANRAEVHAELGKNISVSQLPVPAQVETSANIVSSPTAGVSCIIDTPGQDALLSLMLRRIWGVVE
ncbi:nucleoside hydrolase [Rickenella mellea]|uniref:Nucleoside hydrolase n=1 Tax=Rickenella mellea TaxID=50990 RepID=A0A4Y7QG27_9AGAM|nr:nucleoside hydrolase [Rickenella mellea]